MRIQSEMFRFAANEHGWPMRVVEHRPVACVPSGDVLRCVAVSGVYKPAGRTDWKWLC